MELFSKDQRISLFFQKGSVFVEMVCIIEQVFDDRLILTPPQYFMRYIDSLKEGIELTAKVFTKLGTIDFNTIIISSPLEDNFAIELDLNAIKLTKNDEIPVVKAMESLEINTGSETFKVKTFELSTEYLRFYSDKSLQKNEVFNFTIFFPKDYGIINFKGIITEIDQIYENEYTATYTTMTEADKQSLLYYMYMYSTNSD